VRDAFGRFATAASTWSGSPWSFVAHLVVVAVFLAAGPLVGADTVMLVLTTALTVATELLAVLILNTQNSENRALHLKLDELIRTQDQARNSLLDLERRDDSDIERVEREMEARQDE
jgi:low affinity Fe/Cu permease